MQSNKNFVTVTTVAVTITLIFYTIFNKYITPSILAAVPEFGFVASIFASIGFYLLIFNALTWIYYNFVDSFVNAKESITGEWFYKLVIKGKENSPRYGLCLISRHSNELMSSGIHFNPEMKKFTSRFSTEFVNIHGHTVMMLYSSFGVDDEIFTRKGVFFLSTEGVPPKRIYGVWTDILPSKNVGEIIMERRDTETDIFLKSTGYPFNQTEFQKNLQKDLMKVK